MSPFDPASARFRADSLQKLRDFFRARGALEVETPILSRGVSLDCHIDVFSAQYYRAGFPKESRPVDGGGAPKDVPAGAAPGAAKPGNTSVTPSERGEVPPYGLPGDATFFLQTSPEPHMKRLLCAGFPDIFQITKAFRNGESGRVHNPEFTMLEWYRRGWSLEALMDEVAAVCALVAGPRPVIRKTHREVFLSALGVDPLVVSAAEIAALPAVAARLPRGHVFASKPDALDFAMAHAVEPAFDPKVYTFVHGFPSEQAAQAQVWRDDPRVAHRFEVYGEGMELGNGYLELLDPVEYARRFTEENRKRVSVGKPELPPDPALLAALEAGLPPCAGVAMGVDRLLLIGSGGGDIASVLSFPWNAC